MTCRQPAPISRFSTNFLFARYSAVTAADITRKQVRLSHGVAQIHPRNQPRAPHNQQETFCPAYFVLMLF